MHKKMKGHCSSAPTPRLIFTTAQHSSSPSLRSPITGTVPARDGHLTVSVVSQIRWEMFSEGLFSWRLLLSHWAKTQSITKVTAGCWAFRWNPGTEWDVRPHVFMEPPKWSHWVVTGGTFELPFKIFYNIEAFTLSPTWWFALPTTAYWKLVLEQLEGEVTPEPCWDPSKPHPWETRWCQMGGEDSAAVLQTWGLREASRWIQGLK